MLIVPECIWPLLSLIHSTNILVQSLLYPSVCVCVYWDKTLDESPLSKQILNAGRSFLCPCPCACVCVCVCAYARLAPHRPVLLGVPVFPGADRCAVPRDGGLPLLRPWPLHALRGDGRRAHPSVDAAEFGLRWTRSVGNSIARTWEHYTLGYTL